MELVDEFIHRSPLLPLEIDKLTEDHLSSLFEKDYIREALYLASPEVYSELIKLYNSEIKDIKTRNKLIVSFTKYVLRMQSRCTPYGLFAGCTLGYHSQKTSINYKGVHFPNETIIRHTRLDMVFITSLVTWLNTIPIVRKHAKYFPNNSLYKVGNNLRYVEYKISKTTKLYQLTNIQRSDYIEKILISSRSGMTITELGKTIVDKDITLHEAVEFIEELIENQILVSEIEPALTGLEVIDQLLNTLTNINSTYNEIDLKNIIQILSALKKELRALDNNIINNVKEYKRILEKFAAFKSIIKENEFFQVDSYKAFDGLTLNNNIADSLKSVITVLNKLSPQGEHAGLKKFKERFVDRYGDAEIPLLEALDSETGIGYPEKDLNGTSPLIDNLVIDEKIKGIPTTSRNNSQEILYKKLIDSYKENSPKIIIRDEDLASLEGDHDGLPLSMAILYEILEDGKKLHIKGFAGPSAPILLGRFAHSNDSINTLIKKIASFESEQHQDKIFAEVVHLPETRMGNVIVRPILRQYEIPYLSNSGTKPEFQIEVSDLFLSVKNNKLVLRSKKLDKEIIPRLSSAHNYVSNTLPVYHFLGDMQSNNFKKLDLGFNWGSVSSSLKFLPRVEYKNCILSPATWDLVKGDYLELTESKEKTKTIINKWRLKLQIPDRILVCEGDNELLIDFNNDLCQEVFLSQTRKKNGLLLKEFLFDPNNCYIKDNNGLPYANEFISIVKNPILNPTRKAALNFTKGIEKKSYSLGSEWCYYKLYCGLKSADLILEEAIAPAIKCLNDKNIISKWFFIRYFDIDWHLRVRFRLKDPTKLGVLINQLYFHLEPFVKSGIISKIQTDDYIQEINRYGENTIEIAESFFYEDSNAFLDFLSITNRELRENYRWKFALRSVNNLLDAFGFDLESKLNFSEMLKEAFICEFGNNKTLKIQLDEKYRQLRPEISQFLNQPFTDDCESLENILAEKDKKITNLIKQINETEINGNHIPNITGFAESYIHMMLNRIFANRQRVHEMTIYYLLYKHYKSESALLKTKNKIQIF